MTTPDDQLKGPSFSRLCGSAAGLAAWAIAFTFSLGAFRALTDALDLQFRYEPSPWGIMTPWTLREYPHQIDKFYYYFGVGWALAVTTAVAAAWLLFARGLARRLGDVSLAAWSATACLLPLLGVTAGALYCRDGLLTLLSSSLLTAALAALTVQSAVRRGVWPRLVRERLIRPVELGAMAAGGGCGGLALRLAVFTGPQYTDGLRLACVVTAPIVVLVVVLLLAMAGAGTRDAAVFRSRVIRLTRFCLPALLLLFADVWHTASGVRWFGPLVVTAAGALLAALPTGRARERAAVSPFLFACLLAAALVARMEMPWPLVHAVLSGAPETTLLHPGFVSTTELGFRAETAWRVAHGEFQGKDFYCLYGPLYTLYRAAVGVMLGGRFLYGVALSNALEHVFGVLCFMLLVWSMTRRAGWTILGGLAVLATFSGSARLGLAYLVGAALFAAIDTRRYACCLFMGAALGLSLAYSQEFGISAAVTLALLGLVYAVRNSARTALAAGGLAVVGAAAVLAPMYLYFRAGGAWTPMLHDLAEYPRLVGAGYGFQPMPAFSKVVDAVSSGGLGLDRLSVLNVGNAAAFYLLPSLMVAGGILFFRRLCADRWILSALSIRLGFVSGMGMLAVHTVLGRSDTGHLVYLSPWAILLVMLGVQAALKRRPSATPGVAIGLGVAALLLFAPATQLLAPLDRLSSALAAMPSLSGRTAADYTDGCLAEDAGPPGPELDHMKQVVQYVQGVTAPTDRVCFWPLHAVLNYVSQRFDDGRFSIVWFAITDEHRAEMLASLQRRPPRIIVLHRFGWDVGDGISMAHYVPDVWRFVIENYVRETQIGEFSILRYDPPPPTGDRHGVIVEYYPLDRSMTEFPDLAGRRPSQAVALRGYIGVPQVLDFLAVPLDRRKYFALRWEGDLRIDADGEYGFGTASDDGSRLFVDGALVVDNGGAHAAQRREGAVRLSPGLHHLVIEYFEAGGGMTCDVWWSPPGGTPGEIPVSNLILRRSES